MRTFDNLSMQEPRFLAPSSNAHTYRLLIFKERGSRRGFGASSLPFASKRCVRQQQRRESMKRFLNLVNPLFLPLLAALKAASASGKRDYSKSMTHPASPRLTDFAPPTIEHRYQHLQYYLLLTISENHYHLALQSANEVKRSSQDRKSVV